MANPICLSPLKFYDSVSKQSHRKSYAYGHISPLLCKLGYIPPFQIDVRKEIIQSDNDGIVIQQVELISLNDETKIIDVTQHIINDLTIDNGKLIYFGKSVLNNNLLFEEGYYYIKILYTIKVDIPVYKKRIYYTPIRHNDPVDISLLFLRFSKAFTGNEVNPDDPNYKDIRVDGIAFSGTPMEASHNIPWYNGERHYELSEKQFRNSDGHPYQGYTRIFIGGVEITSASQVTGMHCVNDSSIEFIDMRTLPSYPVTPSIEYKRGTSSEPPIWHISNMTFNDEDDIDHYEPEYLSVHECFSEVMCFTNDLHDCIEIEYWNPEADFELKDGSISFIDNFHFKMFLKSELGKPEYNFEEEATKRLGYNFIESQVSKKVYKFNTVIPEFLCDALRIVRMCSHKILRSQEEEYDMLSFDMDVDWQEQGDLASVTCEFEVDNIIINLGGFRVD